MAAIGVGHRLRRPVDFHACLGVEAWERASLNLITVHRMRHSLAGLHHRDARQEGGRIWVLLVRRSAAPIEEMAA